MKQGSRWHFRFGLRSLLVLQVAVSLFLGVRFYLGYGERAVRKIVGEHGGYTICDGVASEWRAASKCLSFIMGRDFFAGEVSVVIYNGPLTERELRQLCTIPQLRTLDLTDASLPLGSWVRLSEASGLQVLILNGTNFEDTDAQHLLGLQELTRLELSDTRITDATLAKVKDLPNLKKLVIDRTSITDAGLAMLAKHHQLRELSVFGTRTTEEAVNALRESAASLITVDWYPVAANAESTIVDVIHTQSGVEEEREMGAEIGAGLDLELTDRDK